MATEPMPPNEVAETLMQNLDKERAILRQVETLGNIQGAYKQRRFVRALEQAIFFMDVYIFDQGQQAVQSTDIKKFLEGGDGEAG